MVAPARLALGSLVRPTHRFGVCFRVSLFWSLLFLQSLLCMTIFFNLRYFTGSPAKFGFPAASGAQSTRNMSMSGDGVGPKVTGVPTSFASAPAKPAQAPNNGLYGFGVFLLSFFCSGFRPKVTAVPASFGSIVPSTASTMTAVVSIESAPTYLAAYPLIEHLPLNTAQPISVIRSDANTSMNTFYIQATDDKTVENVCLFIFKSKILNF
jgi:hypothetical protein